MTLTKFTDAWSRDVSPELVQAAPVVTGGDTTNGMRTINELISSGVDVVEALTSFGLEVTEAGLKIFDGIEYRALNLAGSTVDLFGRAVDAVIVNPTTGLIDGVLDSTGALITDVTTSTTNSVTKILKYAAPIAVGVICLIVIFKHKANTVEDNSNVNNY